MEDAWVDGDVDSPRYSLIQSQRRQLLAEGFTFCDNTRESAATPSLNEVSSVYGAKRQYSQLGSCIICQTQ